MKEPAVSRAQGHPISITCGIRSYRIDTDKLTRIAERVCGALGVADRELGVTLVGSRAIQRLNKRFRGIDKATDVLSFPQTDWPKPLAVKKPVARKARPKHAKTIPLDALGDVVISLPDAERNAKGIGQPIDREVCFLMVHGILHLCGHDHEVAKDERKMLTAQRALMRMLQGRGKKPLWLGSVKPALRRARG